MEYIATILIAIALSWVLGGGFTFIVYGALLMTTSNTILEPGWATAIAFFGGTLIGGYFAGLLAGEVLSRKGHDHRWGFAISALFGGMAGGIIVLLIKEDS